MSRVDDLADRIVAGIQAAVNPTPPDVWMPLGYTPHPTQAEFHAIAPFSEGGPWDVLYGGAMGPGKSYALLFDAIDKAARYPGLTVWFVRDTYPNLLMESIKDLEGIAFAVEIGGRWNGTEHLLRLPNGSQIRFLHARNVAEAATVRGQVQYLIVDERSHLDPEIVTTLATRIRSGRADVPVIGIRSGTNPGKVGHGWLRQRFIDPAPLGRQPIPIREGDDPLEDDAPVVTANGRALERYFLPAFPSDNPSLDDSYYARFSLMSPEMQRAYRDGDWSGFPGERFERWSNGLHVVEPFDISVAERRGLGVDWGSSAPFAAVWGAIVNEQLVVYRELHRPGLTPTEQARMILDVEADGERDPRRPVPTWLDPATWARSPGQPLAKPIEPDAPPPGSIAHGFEQAGVHVRKAFNDRVAGWSLIDELLAPRDDGRPGIVFFSTCVNTIRSLSSAPRDQRHPEDVDQAYKDDHAADAARYLVSGLMRHNASALPKREVRRHRNGDRVAALTGGVRRMGF